MPITQKPPRLWGFSPLADQQLGGIIMKVVWMVVFLLAICIVFLRWFGREESEAREGRTRTRTPSLLMGWWQAQIIAGSRQGTRG